MPNLASICFYWLLLSAICAPDVSKFPFDQQTCVFSFNLENSIESVYFDDPSIWLPLEDKGEWQFVTADVSNETTLKFQGSVVSIVNYVIVIGRRSGYYVSNRIAPNLIIGTLQFPMPPNLPDRPIFSGTLLLAIIVAEMDRLNDLPKTSGRILISDYMLMLTFHSAFVSLYHLFASISIAKRHKVNTPEQQPQTYAQRVAPVCGQYLSFARFIDLCAFFVSILFLAGIYVYMSVVVTAI